MYYPWETDFGPRSLKGLNLPLSTPTNILSRTKSSMTTNSLIKNTNSKSSDDESRVVKSHVSIDFPGFKNISKSYYETFINNEPSHSDIFLVLIVIFVFLLFLQLF
jgi:hypothetical protein